MSDVCSRCGSITGQGGHACLPEFCRSLIGGLHYTEDQRVRFCEPDPLPPGRELHGPFRSDMDPDWLEKADAEAADMMRAIREHAPWFNRGQR